MATKQDSGSVTIPFILEKETKGTFRYAEVGDAAGHKIGALYVKKSCPLAGSPGLQVTLTAVKS